MGFLDRLLGKPPAPTRAAVLSFSGGSASFGVEDVFDIAGIGTVAVGRVSGGVVSAGQHGSLRGKPFKVKSIEMHHQVLSSATEGQAVGLSLEGLHPRDVRRGDVLRLG